MYPLERLVPDSTTVAQQMRIHDWSQCALGAPANWPEPLQLAVNMCLESEALLGVFWGSESCFIYNDAWRELLANRHPTALGRPAKEVFLGNWQVLAETCEQVLASGEAAHVRCRLPETDGGGYLNHSLSPLRNLNGDIHGVFAVTTRVDLPVHKVDDADFRALLSAADAGISETNADGVFIHVNERYCELVGRDRSELIGKMTFLDVTHSDDIPQSANLVSTTAERGHPFIFEKRYLRPDGSIIWASIIASWAGGPAGDAVGRWIAVSVDISERKQAEKAMRESEERKSFLLRLGDRLRPLCDPLAVMDCAAQMLGEYLGANRVSYGEVSPDGRALAGRDYVDGVNSLPRRLHLGIYAPAVMEQFLADRTSVAADVYTDPSLTEELREAWDSVAVRAHVSVPLRKNGQLVAALGVHQSQPRQWTDTEISLIEETAERTWAAVEQARAEEALRSSEARLSAIFAQAAVGLSEIALDGRFKHVNDELCRLLGRSREELLGMNVADVTHPLDIPPSQAALAEMVEKGVPVSLDKRYLHADRSTVFANSTLSRLDDDAGRARAALVVTVDLGERKRAEAALAEELADNKRLQGISTRLIPSDDISRLYRDLVAAAVDITRADQGTLQLFDKKNAQLQILASQGVDQQLSETFRTMDADCLTACGEAIRQKRRVIVRDYATDPRFREGQPAKAHVAAGVRSAQSTPLISRAGRMVGMISCHWRKLYEPDERQLRLLDILARQAADLIERHQSEAALRDSELRYRTLFSSIDEGFAVIEMYFDGQGNAIDMEYLEVNDAFSKHTGLSQVMGKRMSEIAPELEKYWFETYGRVALTGEPHRFANETQAFGGRWFDVYAFRFGGPESRRVAVLFSDISARVLAEQELKEADRRKNEFLAMLAHELRNPLAPIRTGLEVLRLSQGQRQTTENMLELMERQMEQMVRLVDDLLDISRITQGKVQIRRELCDLQTIVNNAVEGSRPLIGASGVKLTITTPPEPIELRADPARLSQVFSNLLNNAAKYTNGGGQVWFIAERHESDLIVTVRDTGTGIPADKLRIIFEAFTQVDNSLGRSQGGLGVGLSLVETLVSLHGGTVSAYSEGLGKGSEFIVRLPGIASLRAIENLPMDEDSESSTSGHRILVVDDNTDAANALAMFLRIMGNEVRVGHDGRDAITQAEAFRPHLLLLDLGMPELDGYEAARRIRAQPWGSDMVIAALTGWGQDEDRRRSREAGFDHHLVKPVERDALHDLVSELEPLAD